MRQIIWAFAGFVFGYVVGRAHELYSEYRFWNHG